jgi:large subunit ribosomal protein L26e
LIYAHQKHNEVQAVQGHYRDQQIGKVIQVYQKKYVIYIEWVQREKASGTTVQLKLDKDHKKIPEWKVKSCQVAKSKYK